MPIEIKGYEQFIPPSPFSLLDVEEFSRKVTVEDKFDLYDSSHTRRYEVAVLSLSSRNKLCIASLSAKVGTFSWGRLMTVGEQRSCNNDKIQQFIQVPVIPDQPETELTIADIMRFNSMRNEWEKFTTGSFAGSRLHIVSELAALGGVALARNLPESVDVSATIEAFITNLNNENYAPPNIVQGN